MPNTKALDEHYSALSDEELLKLAVGGGLTEQAEQVLGKELARRNLTLDQAKRHFAPEWLDKAAVGTIGVLVLEDGERITGEVAGLNEEGNRLAVKMISPDSPSRKGHRSHRDIPFHRIASFEPQPHLMEQWPFCDPCRQRSTPSRLFLMSAIFLFMTVGSVPLYLLLIKTPYGFQEASIISYTLVVVFFTFATTGSGPSGGNVPGYKFTCPAVEPQVPRLLWRHLIFLVALFVLQTALLTVHPQLPDWWNARDRKGMTASMRLYFSLASVWLGHRFLQTSPFSTARTGSFLTGPGAPCLHRDVGSPGAPSSRSDEVG